MEIFDTTQLYSMGKRGQRQRGKRGPTVLVLLVIGWNCLCENFGEEHLQLATRCFVLQLLATKTKFFVVVEC